MKVWGTVWLTAVHIKLNWWFWGHLDEWRNVCLHPLVNGTAIDFVSSLSSPVYWSDLESLLGAITQSPKGFRFCHTATRKEKYWKSILLPASSQIVTCALLSPDRLMSLHPIPPLTTTHLRWFVLALLSQEIIQDLTSTPP